MKQQRLKGERRMITTLSTEWRFAQLAASFTILLAVAVSLVIFVPKTTRASGSYDNASIANIALGYVGKSGTAACADAGKTGGDQCKQFANCIVWMASNHTQWPVTGYQDGFANAGGTQVTSANAVKGDIIQVGNSDTANPLHTAIVVTNYGNGKFNVVDANWKYDGMVRQHNYTPPSSAEFWRMGTVINSPPPHIPSTPIAVSRSASTMDVFYNDGNNHIVNYFWGTNGWQSGNWSDNNIAGQPTVIDRTSNNLDVFYRTTDGKLRYRAWTASNGWGNVVTMVSSGVGGDPWALARDSNHMQIFYLTTSGQMASINWDINLGWNLTPQILYNAGATTDPVAVSRNTDSMEVFFGKNNGNLVHVYWSSEKGWQIEDFSAGNGVDGRPTAIVRNGGNDMSVYYKEQKSGKVAEEFWDINNGWGWQDWTASLAGIPSAIPGISNTIDDFYKESGGNIVDRYFSSCGWCTTNIVNPGGSTGNPTAIVRGGTSIEVFYWDGTALMDANWNTSSQTWAVGKLN